jgi:hypothetical protein
MQIRDSRFSAKPKDPEVLSYKALRRAVGYVAIALPFALVIPYLLDSDHRIIQGSISAYYYTGLRNVFVGSLCAIAMFMICARGYDKKDEYAGFLAAICAIGVAFCPMSPRNIQIKIASATEPRFPLHYPFAVLLFLTLGYFCLVLFRMTDGKLTRQKLQRNTVYAVCGWTIYIAMATEAFLGFLAKSGALPRWLGEHHLLLCEIACLWAFGYAWLIKGEGFFKDVPPDHTPSVAVDRLKP